MSVFSIMKRRQGKEGKEDKEDKISSKLASKQKQEAAPPHKYRHVPTHAAADALLGAPAGWMRGDAEKIRESNQKRIASESASSSSSSSMLSPLHINIHASASSSSASSQYRKTIAATPAPPSSATAATPAPPSSATAATTANMHMSPSFNSLDAELYRARVPAADTQDSYVFV